MIDVSEQINAVRREVGARTLEAGEARVVTVSQAYDVTVDDLWDACTNPERVARWFLPLSGDLRVGGRYSLEGNASGTIERCDPPKGFAATWEYDGNLSWIEVRVAAEPDGGARFHLDHIATVGDDWAQYGPGAVGIGWDMALVGLTRYLSTGAAADPKEAMAWFGSPDGERFVTLSAHGWRDAQIAFGDAPATAEAAADRTLKAYTG